MGFKVLDDHHHFLADIVIVQTHPLIELDLGFFAFDFLVDILHLHRQVISDFVVGVVLQHIKNKALFDRLAHAVDVKCGGLIGLRSWLFRARQAAE